METCADIDSRLIATPAKPTETENDSDEDFSVISSLSSPTPFSASLARKSPPALSIKRRKGTGLFAESPGPGSAKHVDTVGSALSKHHDNASGSSGGGDDHDEVEDTPLSRVGSQGKESGTFDRTSSSSGTSLFASPERRSPIEDLLCSSRITPQRNLGGLFVSPVAARREDIGNKDAFPTPRVPRQLHSPEREKLAAGAPARDAPVDETPSTSPVSGGDPRADDQPTGPEVTVEEAKAETKTTMTEPKGSEKESAVTGSVCVSNEALRSQPVEAMCTLEVLVKQTRERVGVSALSFWRVAELKKRLVYLNMFARPESITLTPRYEEEALKDDVSLGSLDTDVTYEARAVPVS